MRKSPNNLRKVREMGNNSNRSRSENGPYILKILGQLSILRFENTSESCILKEKTMTTQHMNNPNLYFYKGKENGLIKKNGQNDTLMRQNFNKKNTFWISCISMSS